MFLIKLVWPKNGKKRVALSTTLETVIDDFGGDWVVVSLENLSTATDRIYKGGGTIKKVVPQK